MLRAKARQSAPTASTSVRLVRAVLEFIAFLLEFAFLNYGYLEFGPNPASAISMLVTGIVVPR